MTRLILRRLQAIEDREVTFQRRGFQASSEEKRRRLENIGRRFVEGYHDALEHDPEALEERLAGVELEDRGFAYEGAAMALAIQDALIPFRRRLRSWLMGPGMPHEYMTYVGVGWAIARIPWHRAQAERRARLLHRFYWPLVLDGYGFHEGYFHAGKPAGIARAKGIDSGHGRSAYDQGLGRSLWFSGGADPSRVAGMIGEFERSRHVDLWSGAGLACAYAGGVSEQEVEMLARLAGEHAGAAGQGSCFAAKARQRAGNQAEHTKLACRVLCGMTATEAAALCDETYAETVELGGNFRHWRALVQTRLEQVSAARK
jgi:hypothetical protein